MRGKRHFTDYESVTRSRQVNLRENDQAKEDWPRRSGAEAAEDGSADGHAGAERAGATDQPPPRIVRAGGEPSWVLRRGRSEEHTSELQSLAYLVCRLLLEKKKQRDTATFT